MVIHHLLECTKPSDSSYISLEAEISLENDLKMVGKNPHLAVSLCDCVAALATPKGTYHFLVSGGGWGAGGVVKIGLVSHAISCNQVTIAMSYDSYCRFMWFIK
jgi:hypothetical protein